MAFTPELTFVPRHIGPGDSDIAAMLKTVGFESLDSLIDTAVPESIRLRRDLDLGPARTEHDVLATLKDIMSQNRLLPSYIGLGYHGCITPPVIQRNILENPGWYTQYTPYQAEIAQGRLEMLFNYQTMVSDLTGLPCANASLLDEGTAAAEAMSMSLRVRPRKSEANRFFISDTCHPQTIEVVKTRAAALGVETVIGCHTNITLDEGFFGLLLQYPTTNGDIPDYRPIIGRAHECGAVVTLAADILALALITSPGELGADIAVGSTQRLGIPMGYGGPHAAYFATRDQWKRQLPGRIIGLSKDVHGAPALRMALQTREQHIRRDRATSNICTAQVLLAIMAGAYGIYHGPDGIRREAQRVYELANALRGGLKRLGLQVDEGPIFDTVRVRGAVSAPDGINLRQFSDGLGITVDSTHTPTDILDVLQRFGAKTTDLSRLRSAVPDLPDSLVRTTSFMTHPVFSSHRSETAMLRYLTRLQDRDLSLTHSMIPLGSCTMKLNATAEMIPVTWPEVGGLHPFCPVEQTQGYQQMFRQLEGWLAEITGFAAVSLQPNAGSQGEYAGLLVIRAYHEARDDHDRKICLIPTSAHGTNPASAVMAGFDVVTVKCDSDGNIDVDDLNAKAEAHSARLGALMITYPSTHGVFESAVTEICATVHKHGGQVYMDGANMNAQVGLCRPGDFGADVVHLNLHKTFCIPHGGGGPGMGPIAVGAHLADFLPGHPLISTGGDQGIGAIAAAPYGSASILPISWAYIAMMGAKGLTDATKVAILNANYIAKRLEPHYPILYRGNADCVAHECILDVRPLKDLAGVTVDDIAKRLIDYGFHAPTMSWPVPGTLMIEPTESEDKAELDRFCDALIAIRKEAQAIADQTIDPLDNPLKNAPHTAEAVTSDEWNHPYSRKEAAYPTEAVRASKFWPFVGRVDNASGDRNLVCTCPPIEAYEAS